MMTFDVVSLFKDEVEMAEEDLVAMEFALEEYYEDRIAENMLYLKTDAQRIEANEQIQKELNDLTEELIQKEEYEKCSVVKKVAEVIRTKINEANNRT